jgi:hypothetical protein
MMNERTGQSRGKYVLLWALVLLAGLLGWIALLKNGVDTARTWRALLISFTYFISIAGGLVTWSAIVVASNGSWPGSSERLAWTGYGFTVPSIIILVVLWIGSPAWAPWYNKTLHQGFWLNNTFLFVRDLAALIIFWAFGLWYMRRRRKGRDQSRRLAGFFVLIFSAVFSLLGFDLVMALNPEWHSGVFGAYFFISAAYIAICFWAFISAISPEVGPDVRHDFGNLVLSFGIMTTYFFYIQLLTIWYENLPHEISYVVRRMNVSDWRSVSFGLIAVVYIGPLVMLLTRKAKRNRYALGVISLVLLIGLWFERWWLISARFMPVELGWMEIAGTAAGLGALGLGMELMRKRISRLALEEALEEEAQG